MTFISSDPVQVRPLPKRSFGKTRPVTDSRDPPLSFQHTQGDLCRLGPRETHTRRTLSGDGDSPVLVK